MANRDVYWLADGTPQAYGTLADALVAAVAEDLIRIYAPNTNNGIHYFEQFADVTAKPVSVQQIYPRSIAVMDAGGSFYAIAGDISGLSNPLTVTGVTFRGILRSSASTYAFLNWNDTSGTEAIEVSNCNIGGYYNGLLVTSVGLTAWNNIIMNVRRGMTLSAAATIYFNTFISFDVWGVDANNVAADIQNNLVFSNLGVGFLAHENCTGKNNASWDATAADGNWSGGAGTNNRINERYNDIKFLREYGNGFFPEEYRIHPDSSLVGQGLTIAGYGNDIDDDLRDANPAIGAAEGKNLAPTSGGGTQIGAWNPKWQ